MIRGVTVHRAKDMDQFVSFGVVWTTYHVWTALDFKGQFPKQGLHSKMYYYYYFFFTKTIKDILFKDVCAYFKKKKSQNSY